MAELCFNCYKAFIDPNADMRRLVLSDEPDLCEGCGQVVPVVLGDKGDDEL